MMMMSRMMMMRGHVLNTTANTIIDIILVTFPDKISGLLCPDTRTCLRSFFIIQNIQHHLHHIHHQWHDYLLYHCIISKHHDHYVMCNQNGIMPLSKFCFKLFARTSLSWSHILSASSYNQHHHHHHHLRRRVFLDMPLSTFCRWLPASNIIFIIIYIYIKFISIYYWYNSIWH